MLDQAFTSENFRKIFDLENRKGLYLESKYFPEVEKLTKRITETKIEIKNLIKQKDNYSKYDFDAALEALNQKKVSLTEENEALLEKELEILSVEIVKAKFEINLEQLNGPGGKPVYSIRNEPIAFFAEKQVQYNLYKTFNIRQGNRYNIISQLRHVLDDNVPKIVIRTDIESFYESIDPSILRKLVNRNSLLSEPSKRVIRSILASYRTLSKNQTGVPRGVGISAYLSELYMRNFDQALRSMDDVIYYARYVDDIVIVFSPKPTSIFGDYLKSVKKNAGDLKLNLNKTKTQIIELTTSKQQKTIDYLGYSLTFGTKKTIVTITKSKIQKYRDRIQLVFDDYDKRKFSNEKKARKLLFMRLKFLTGNTRLLNNKKNAMVGIFYTNPHVTDSKCLNGLDAFLKSRINLLSSNSLQHRLNKLSFVDGFVERIFSKYSAQELVLIVKVWRHAS